MTEQSLHGVTAGVVDAGAILGRACAHRLARMGAHVAVIGADPDAVAGLCADIRDAGFEADHATAQTADAESMRAAAQWCGERWPAVGVLINCHFLAEVGSVATSPQTLWTDAFATNFF